MVVGFIRVSRVSRVDRASRVDRGMLFGHHTWAAARAADV
jgi:hypothetical protein